MADQFGALRKDEIYRINAGLWAEYIPDHLRSDIKSCVDAGFRVVPAFINGYNTGVGHIVYQLMPLENERPMLITAPTT